MARKKGHRRGQQGIVSWLTSMAAILIGLGPLFKELAYWLLGGGPFWGMADNLQRYYNPLRGDRDALTQGYGSLAGGLIFKIATAELAKRAKMRSLVPALHA